MGFFRHSKSHHSSEVALCGHNPIYVAIIFPIPPLPFGKSLSIPNASWKSRKIRKQSRGERDQAASSCQRPAPPACPSCHRWATACPLQASENGCCVGLWMGCVSIYLSIYLSINLLIYLSIYLSIYIYIYIYILLQMRKC